MEEQAEDLKELLQGGVTGATPYVSETVSNNGHKTRIIAITSGKGGVGKTNISVNMAIAYAQLGKKVILIDGDLGMANVNVLMNVVPQYNLMHVINKKKTMKEIILDTEFGIKFIAGANGFSKLANLSEEELELYDLLVKGKKLTKDEELKVKLAAKHLFTTLKENKEKKKRHTQNTAQRLGVP